MKIKPVPGSRSTFIHPMPVDPGGDRARMMDLLGRHWRLNRSAVNSDTNILVRYLAEQLDARVVEAAAGSECLTWTMPAHWRVRKGQLRRLNGDVLCDFANNPLHLWTHSVAFEGIVGREELLSRHINTDPTRPDEFIYHFRNGYRQGVREWGFSLPYRLLEQFDDSSFQVEIDADLDMDGSLKVVDAFLPGRLPDTIFIMAHTCHPALVSDGIGCIAIAVELYHLLKAMPERCYSYRFLFGPEYFAAAAYLSKAGPEALESLRFGIYLDMLTTHEPLGFQSSLQGDSRADHVCRNVLSSHVSTLIERPYRRLWGNDEMFYNGPGFNIPTIGLGRLMHREYHYNTDDMDHVDFYHADEALWVLRRMVEVFETDYVPKPRFKGPIYLARYNIPVDFQPPPQDPETLNLLLSMMDGRLSCQDMAQRLGLDFFQVRDFCDHLVRLDLADKSPRLPRTEDQGSPLVSGFDLNRLGQPR
jgi:aminopeptidase-like protein